MVVPSIVQFRHDDSELTLRFGNETAKPTSWILIWLLNDSQSLWYHQFLVRPYCYIISYIALLLYYNPYCYSVPIVLFCLYMISLLSYHVVWGSQAGSSSAPGWWQQSIQMFCALAVASQATAASGQCWSSVLGECLLQLGRPRCCFCLHGERTWKSGKKENNVPSVPLNNSWFLTFMTFIGWLKEGLDNCKDHKKIQKYQKVRHVLQQACKTSLKGFKKYPAWSKTITTSPQINSNHPNIPSFFRFQHLSTNMSHNYNYITMTIPNFSYNYI